MIFSRCYDYRVWFWGFSYDNNIRFADKLPILWLITRKILRQNVSKYFIGMFYVVSDRYSTEYRGGENWTQKYTHFGSFFVKVTLKNVKITRDFRFLSKFNRKWNFYEVTCHHMQASRRRSKTRLLWFICWTWTKIEFQWISDLKNDDFGKK